MIRCAQCKVDLPNVIDGQDWDFKLGAHMYFCTKGCMETKQAAIKAKQAETFERKKQEKSVKQYLMEQKAEEEREKREIAAEMARITKEKPEKVTIHIPTAAKSEKVPLPSAPKPQEEKPMQQFKPIEETNWNQELKEIGVTIPDYVGEAENTEAKVAKAEKAAKPRRKEKKPVMLDDAQKEYLSHMVEQKLLDMLPPGLDIKWLRDMLELMEMLKGE